MAIPPPPGTPADNVHKNPLATSSAAPHSTYESAYTWITKEEIRKVRLEIDDLISRATAKQDNPLACIRLIGEACGMLRVLDACKQLTYQEKKVFLDDLSSIEGDLNEELKAFQKLEEKGKEDTGGTTPV